MSLFDYFRYDRQRNTAAVAKERLQIIVAHERGKRSPSTLDYLPLLQKELLEVIRKYVVVGDDQIKIHIEKDGDCEILELNIALPETERQVK
jgi:cell division topological specificity factor